MLPFDTVTALALGILTLPLLSFFILFFYGKKIFHKGDWFGTAIIGICFLLSIAVFVLHQQSGLESIIARVPWFSLGKAKFTVSVSVTSIAAIMLIVVTFISFLVHMYSIEYMKGKLNYERYFPYLGLFTFAMIGIVLSDNILITFMFWELVGLSSYLLIGFWFEKDSAVKASKKAFLVNRIGDVGFLIGILFLYSRFGTFELNAIYEVVKTFDAEDKSYLFFTIAGLGIFMGCVGKSAQFPLQIWLPDAMEGPTPVSALIHAATMVAAGVYLLAKTYFLFNEDTLLIIAVIGAVTTLAGALPAMVQHDIKKVLAFSTISQLGYMVMAMGVKAYEAALFHLVTHAFFKACLFLSVGAVIHAMHHIKHDLFLKGNYLNFDSQDMRIMGGFKKIMPVTFAAYFISSMALVGVPLFSGFLSKDAILLATWDWASANVSKNGSITYYLIPATAFVTVFITAFYIFRQMYLVFFTDFRLADFYKEANEVFGRMHEVPWLMRFPLIVLSVCSLGFAFSINPFSVNASWFVHLVKSPIPGISPEGLHGAWVPVLSIVMAAIGLFMGYRVYKEVAENNFKAMRRTLLASENVYLFFKNNFFLDKLYKTIIIKPGIAVAAVTSRTDSKLVDGFIHFISVSTVVFAHIVAWVDKYVVDGLVNLVAIVAQATGKVTASIQKGKIQSYFIFTLIAVILLVLFLYGLLN
ncbi:MAG TPA: NADH-quinone oxidoreductase subunit L [Cytophagaceae bacterium]